MNVGLCGKLASLVHVHLKKTCKQTDKQYFDTFYLTYCFLFLVLQSN